ncbi:ABC transporter substrate-binding protein [Acinetobacter larvae]|uniref:Sulfate ester-binding protein n=1 Tax=Acinetobacter larvae TaxID=1789224 RepID=A0A1B2LVU4_9GAMM|nr:ABC transporter substrate-binding protein [Acinetobacter larvae]AOA57039.1 sulfate ester-binding protein [Acinetobacter larvae]
MLSTKKPTHYWTFAVFSLLLLLFLIFKPQAQQGTETHQRATSASPNSTKIVIAVPDLSAGKNSSSANIVVDYLYTHKILEQEFAKDHIQVEWKFFKGAGPAINEALANKQLDFAFLGDLAAIIGKANGLDTRLIAAMGRGTDVYLGVLKGHNYQSLEQLKGKRIAVWQGTAFQLSFAQFIESQGYKRSDFRIVNLDIPATNAALASKQIDAGWGIIPMLALQKQGLIDIPFSTRDTQDGRGAILSGLVARNDFLQQNPALSQRLVNAVLKAYAWTADEKNRQVAIQLVTKNANYPNDLYQRYLEGIALGQIYQPRLDAAYLQQLQRSVDAAAAAQLIHQPFQVSQWADTSWVERAWTELSAEQQIAAVKTGVQQ